MKIVVLDGFTLNPGDLSWKGLQELGECSIYDRSARKDILARADGAEIVLVNKIELSSDMIERLGSLKYIGVTATGYNIVDIEAARRRGIPVTNVPTYGTDSVAQMVFAHLLNLTQNVAHHAQTVRDGRWCSSEDFCYWGTPLIELAGLTMGIIGFGRIGQATAKLALAFGMKVIAHDVTPPAKMPEGCRMAKMEEVFRLADVVSLHCPLTPRTENIVNERNLALMKKTAFLINTSRGSLIDEQALADALNNSQIAGAGLDVLATEPPDELNPLLRARNCHITPHMAWATRAARERLLNAAVENIPAFLAGEPRNIVNGPLAT
ncbi:MAG: D-2-hydroxyacid dehydrogenase [Phycisphaerales bacterium]|nr:MAG: D-2-hydroxyacid dehydrogenase [Phycisphaerales bacterium]